MTTHPRDWDEWPPTIPPRFRLPVVVGIFCTGAATGVGITTVIFTIGGTL